MAPVLRPGERQHVAGVAAHVLKAAPCQIEDAHTSVERAGRNALVVRREDGHVDVVGVAPEYGMEPQARHGPDTRRVVAACSEQPVSVGAEGAMIDEVIMMTTRKRSTGTGIPENHAVVVPGRGHVVAMRRNARDGPVVAKAVVES